MGGLLKEVRRRSENPEEADQARLEGDQPDGLKFIPGRKEGQANLLSSPCHRGNPRALFYEREFLVQSRCVLSHAASTGPGGSSTVIESFKLRIFRSVRTRIRSVSLVIDRYRMVRRRVYIF